MGQSLKSVLALIVIVTLAASVLGWTTRGIEGVAGSQLWLRLSTLVCIPTLVLLLWAEFRRDQAPDFLKQIARRYFERAGLCFWIQPRVVNGVFHWVVLFQNRYEKACQASIGLRPAVGNFGIKRPALPDFDFELECDGAAFGTLALPCGVPLKYHGKKLSFELAAQTAYPGGRGKLVRFRDGIGVGERNRSAADLVVLAASGLVGHLHYAKQAKFTTRIPEGIPEIPPPAPVAPARILWRPGMPENGVIQAALGTIA